MAASWRAAALRRAAIVYPLLLWRIIETDVWDNDFLDEIQEAHITFQGNSISSGCE